MSQPTAASSPSASMPRASGRGGARPVLEFKGLSHPALRLVLNDAGDDVLAAALDTLIAEDPGFEWQPVVIDASRIAGQPAPDWSVLVARLRSARLHPVALAGAPESTRTEAERLHLGWLAALPERRRGAEAADAGASDAAPSPAVAPASQAGTAADAARAAGIARTPQAASGNASGWAGPTAAGAPDTDETGGGAAGPEAMIVDRPVRSGQQLYARGRDLVVVGDVSPGAEVIADGNVHVYGTLAGRAVAGARGQRGASIFALELRAELVAVCGIYRTFEDGVPKAQSGRPVRITLEANADTLSLKSL